MSMVQYCFTSTETIRLVGTESPGRPHRLSHGSRTMLLRQHSCFSNTDGHSHSNAWYLRIQQKRTTKTMCLLCTVSYTQLFVCLLSRYVTRMRCSGRKVARFFCQQRTKYLPLKDRHHFGLPYVKNDLSCCGLKGGKTDTYHFRERQNIKKGRKKHKH